VINVWWIYIVVIALMVFGVYGFLSLVRFNRERLTSKTDRRAEDLYGNFAEPPRRRRRQP
jgi:hypothetical protein